MSCVKFCWLDVKLFFHYVISYYLFVVNCAGAFSSLLRELVAEFTLTDNPANTTTSLLRSLCHTGDSIILGTWLQETDHKTIEDQVIAPTRSVNVCVSAVL